MRALPADLFCKEVVREWIDSEGRGFLLSCGHTVHLPEVTRAKSGTTTSGVGCEQCIRAAGFPGSSPDRQSPHASDATADNAIDFKELALAFMPELMRHSDTFTEWTLEFPGIVELHVEGGGVWIIGDTNGPIGADYYFSEKDFGEGEPSHYSVEIAASDDPAIIAERLSAAMSAV